jgi:hypothetical protein
MKIYKHYKRSYFYKENITYHINFFKKFSSTKSCFIEFLLQVLL